MTGHDVVDVTIVETTAMIEMTTTTDETVMTTTDADTNQHTATDTTVKRTMTATKTGIPTERTTKRMEQKKKMETTRVDMMIKIADQAVVDEEATETEIETVEETGTVIGDEVETDTMIGIDIGQTITTDS